jgi:hypothetical protein
LEKGIAGTGGQAGDHFLVSQSCASTGIRFVLFHSAYPLVLVFSSSNIPWKRSLSHKGFHRALKYSIATSEAPSQ